MVSEIRGKGRIVLIHYEGTPGKASDVVISIYRTGVMNAIRGYFEEMLTYDPYNPQQKLRRFWQDKLLGEREVESSEEDPFEIGQWLYQNGVRGRDVNAALTELARIIHGTPRPESEEEGNE